MKTTSDKICTLLIEGWMDILSNHGVVLPECDIDYLLSIIHGHSRQDYDSASRVISRLEREEHTTHSTILQGIRDAWNINSSHLKSTLEMNKRALTDTRSAIRQEYWVNVKACDDPAQCDALLAERKRSIDENRAMESDVRRSFELKMQQLMEDRKKSLDLEHRRHNNELRRLDTLRDALDRMWQTNFNLPADEEEADDDQSPRPAPSSLAAQVLAVEERINN